MYLIIYLGNILVSISGAWVNHLLQEATLTPHNLFLSLQMLITSVFPTDHMTCNLTLLDFMSPMFIFHFLVFFRKYMFCQLLRKIQPKDWENKKKYSSSPGRIGAQQSLHRRYAFEGIL